MRRSSPSTGRDDAMAQVQPSTTYEYLLYLTVRLETTVPAGTGLGTGFVYDHLTKGGDKVPLVVTNKHVIKDSIAVKVRFHQRDTAAQRWAVSGYVDLALPIAEAA